MLFCRQSHVTLKRSAEDGSACRGEAESRWGRVDPHYCRRFHERRRVLRDTLCAVAECFAAGRPADFCGGDSCLGRTAGCVVPPCGLMHGHGGAQAMRLAAEWDNVREYIVSE